MGRIASGGSALTQCSAVGMMSIDVVDQYSDSRLTCRNPGGSVDLTAPSGLLPIPHAKRRAPQRRLRLAHLLQFVATEAAGLAVAACGKRLHSGRGRVRQTISSSKRLPTRISAWARRD